MWIPLNCSSWQWGRVDRKWPTKSYKYQCEWMYIMMWYLPPPWLDPSTTAKDKAKNSKSKAPTKGSVSPKNTSPHGRQQKEGKSPMSSPSTSPQKQHSTKMSSSPFSAKEKIACYCRENDKPEAKYQCNPEGAKQYVGKVYLARTCGWVSGDPQPTKARAEEDAAAKLLQKLNI